MPSANKVIIMGNVTKDPEIRYTPKGTAVTEISIAVNEHWTSDSGEKMERTTFVPVSIWGRQAEIVGEYVKKGHPLYVEGRLVLDEWEDKETQQKRQRLKVTADNIQLIRGKEGGGARPADEAEEERQLQKPTAKKFTPPVKEKQERDLELEPEPENDDIPF